MSASVIAASYVAGDAISGISGLHARLRASSMAGLADGALANSSWIDESGNGRHATRNNNGIYYEAADTPMGTDALRFDSAGGSWYSWAAGTFFGLTEATIFVVLKNDAGSGVQNQGPWSLGGGDISFYPYSDDNVYDGAFSTSRTSFAFGSPRNNWRVYSVTSKNSEWRAYVDNLLKGSMASTFQAGAGSQSGNIGRYNTAWHGRIAEIIVYNRVLTAGERTTVHDYLRATHIGSSSFANSGLGLTFPSPGPNQIALVHALKGTTVFTPTGAGTWVEITSRNQNNRVGRVFMGYNFNGSGTVTIVTPTAWALRYIYDLGRPVLTAPSYEVSSYGVNGTLCTTGSVVPNPGDILLAVMSGPGDVAADALSSQSGGNGLGNLLKDGNSSNHICSVTSVASVAATTSAVFNCSGGTSQQAAMCRITR